MIENNTYKTNQDSKLVSSNQPIQIEKNIANSFFNNQENLKDFLLSNCLQNYGQIDKYIIDKNIAIDGNYYLSTKIIEELVENTSTTKLYGATNYLTFNYFIKYFLTDNKQFIPIDSLKSRTKKKIECLCKYEKVNNSGRFYRETIIGLTHNLERKIEDNLEVTIIGLTVKFTSNIKIITNINLIYNYSLILDGNFEFYLENKYDKLKLDDPDEIILQPEYCSITKNNMTFYYNKYFELLGTRINETKKCIKTIEAIEITSEELKLIKNSNLIGLRLIG